jgi:hypothetical protein
LIKNINQNIKCGNSLIDFDIFENSLFEVSAEEKEKITLHRK